MCGITGIYNFKSREPVSRELIIEMANSIAHRGPDEEGIFMDSEAGVGLGFRRLSIIDLITGGQPMANATEDIYIVHNGEIYNFQELKKELQKKSCRFRTNSDTEVILNLYQEYGEKAFHRLNGIFAFAIYDKRKQCVILARDPFGVKPLYYNLTDSRLIFGSEMKAILRVPDFKKTLDFESLNSFFTYLYNPSPQTLIEGIKKLPPSHYLKVSFNGKAELGSYMLRLPRTNENISEREAVEEYQRLLENAVKRQMISDVPVGLLLSGGIDSAIIGHLAQKYSDGTIKTFTIGFHDKTDKSNYNELKEARRTSEIIGSEHFDTLLSRSDNMEFFFKSSYFTEEPLAISTLPALYFLSKLASDQLKVVLSGQGADELLGGYPKYYGEKMIARFAPLIRLLPPKIISKVLVRNARFKKGLYASKFKREVDRFLALTTTFTPEHKKGLFNDEVSGKVGHADLAMLEVLHEQSSQLSDSLSRLLYIDTRMGLSDNLLLCGDKMSMANSLEMRVPFLDIELVEFIESLPSNMKLRGKTQKYIGNVAAKKWLPDEIINRKKIGFESPMDEWLQNDLATASLDILCGKNSASRNYFNLHYIKDLIEQHQQLKEDHHRKIYALLSFELWHKTFFEADIPDYMPVA